MVARSRRERQGGEFTYRIALDAPITFTTSADTACGSRSGDDVASFSSVVVTDASTTPTDSHLYCECDFGCAAPQPSTTITLPAGTYAGTLDWPGVAWSGPSDYGAPYGPTFPVGSYVVKVSFGVPGEGSVSASLPITVVE